MAVELRPVEAGDGPALQAVLGDPAVARWLRPAGVSDAFTAAECDAWAAREAAHWRAHGFGGWIGHEEGRPVARGGLRHTLVAGRAEVELAWAVASSHWGRGIATRLARAGLALAAERGIEGVVAYTRVDNEASRRVAERAGLELERAFEHAGLPHVLYRKTRPIR